MQTNFDQSLALLLKSEGGYVNHPKDPGGPTNLGITLGTARRFGIDVDGDGDTDVADVKALVPRDVGRVYRALYWNVINGDRLPSGVDYAVFDYAVNSGPGRAAKALQIILGVEADGAIGPKTLAAVTGRTDRTRIIDALCDQRLAFLEGLPTWETFKNGWRKRVLQVRIDAKAMVPPPQPKPVPWWRRVFCL